MRCNMTPTRLSLRVVWLVLCVGRAAAVRYGDYSVGRMPQYSDDRDELAPAPAHDQYGDRLPDAPARLDYKYEEEPHGRSDDLPVKDVVDERIWDKPNKKKRKPRIRSGPVRDVDKYSLDETELELNSDKRFVMRGPPFRKRDFAMLSDSQRHSKHDANDQSDDIDSLEGNSDYGHKQDGETAGDDPVDLGRIRYRSSTSRKPRRKPRDRALHPEWRERIDAKLEQGEVDVRSERDDLEIKNPRRFGESIHQQDVKRKNKDNDDYDDYYDMKRVQRMKSRTTVRTTEAKSARHSGHWVIRRADTASPSAPSASSEVTSILPSSTLSTTTAATSSVTRKTSDLSLAEKSRLSILKKAQRKENARNVSASTKPPVLMQVTRKMQTMVMVEPRPPETALRAREVLDDSPERLRRARRLMRHKLVAGAHSIHELTDDWDQMVCDYIDVSLLDTDAASYIDIDTCVRSMLVLYLLALFINS